MPDAMGLNGTTWVNYCEGRPHCDTEETVWRGSRVEGYREADISKRPPIAWDAPNLPYSHWINTSVPAIERTEKGLKLRSSIAIGAARKQRGRRRPSSTTTRQ